MEGKRFIRALRLKNLLSYGSEGETIELQPLNVLIGPNASGKSNLIEAIGLLSATPKDLPAAIRKGGGISEWLWKGEKEPPIAEIDAIVDYPSTSSGTPSTRATEPPLISESLHYRLDFTIVAQRLEIVGEFVADGKDRVVERQGNSYNLLPRDSETEKLPRDSETEMDKFIRGAAIFFSSKLKDPFIFERETTKLLTEQSILSQLKDPVKYESLTYLGNQFSNMSLYRDWHIGRDSESRKPQQTNLPEHPLLEDGSNLGLVLNNLQHQLGSRPIIEKLKKFYDAAEEITPKIYGGTVQLFIREEGLSQPIPASRLSDGTLRYLFLLALLLDPTPPPLICIEEPEIGLHPDILPTIAELLIEASQRTQLIVTTHSDALVSALNPESVLVCERDEKGSHLRRLDPEALKEWLKDFSLGHLWRMGEIGGNRW